MQRKQTIHPFDVSRYKNQKNVVYGDMSKIPCYKLRYENDIFPTAQAILAELLRRDKDYSTKRSAEDKIHICCREQSILLSSILKAKNIPSRCRSGFAPYLNNDYSAGDHWITEYYNKDKNRWVLVDADMHCFDDDLDFDINDIPRNKFIFGADAYLGIRNGSYDDKKIHYASDPITYGLKAAIKGLFYDFHCLMNDEIIFLHVPKYIADKNFELSEEEYKELDELAILMLDPNKNFEKLLNIWDENKKFRIMSGGLN